MSDLTPILGQIDLVADTYPASLGPVLIFLGIEILFVGLFQRVLSEHGLGTRLSGSNRGVVVGTCACGLLFVASGALRQAAIVPEYVILLVCLGQMITAAGTVRFCRRVVDVLRGRGWEGQLRGRIKRGLVMVFLFLVAGGLVIRVLTTGPIVGSTATSLRLIWTGLIVTVGGLGLLWKLRHTKSELRPELRVGLVLCVVGAEVYNFASFPVEVGVFIITSVASTIGFWVAAYYLFKTELAA